MAADDPSVIEAMAAHMKHQHCGCCGRCGSQRWAGGLTGDWCRACTQHLAPARINGEHVPPWDRTYYAQHKQPCPFESEE